MSPIKNDFHVLVPPLRPPFSGIVSSNCRRERAEISCRRECSAATRARSIQRFAHWHSRPTEDKSTSKFAFSLGEGYTAFLTDSEAVLVLRDSSKAPEASSRKIFRFVGERKDDRPSGRGRQVSRLDPRDD